MCEVVLPETLSITTLMHTSNLTIADIRALFNIDSNLKAYNFGVALDESQSIKNDMRICFLKPLKIDPKEQRKIKLKNLPQSK